MHQIRKYLDADLDRVIEIWREASLVATPFLSPEFLAAERGRIRDQWMPIAETWVIESADQVQGFIAMIGREVGGLFVHPLAQGRGFGQALVTHALDLHGSLELSVFEENESGRRFYDRFGFTQIGTDLHEETGKLQLRLTRGK